MKKFFGICALIWLLIAALALGGVACASEAQYQSKTIFSDEDDWFSGMVSMNGQLYTISGEGLYIYPPDGEKKLLASSNVFEASVGTLVTDGQSLYGVAVDGPVYVTELVNAQGNFINRPLLQSHALEGGYVTCEAMHGDMLYFLDHSGEGRILGLDIRTGATRTLPSHGVNAFDVMADGSIVGMDLTSILKIDGMTGVKTTLVDLERFSYAGAMACDPDTGSVYYPARNRIMRWDAENGVQEAARILPGDIISITLLKGGAMAVQVDDWINIVGAPGSGERKRLAIREMYGRGGMYRSFVEANPDIELVFMGEGDITGVTNDQQFVNDMIIGSADTDIYVLTDTNLLTDIKAKEYYLDLSTDGALMARAAQLHPVYTDALMDGDNLAAMPKDAYFNVLAYNKEAFELLGLKLPTTYGEYLDVCLDWFENYNEDYPQYRLYPFSNYTDLKSLLGGYEDEMTFNGKPVNYDTPELAALLEKYQAVKEAYEQAPELDGDSRSLFYCYYMLSIDDAYLYGYLPLAFEAENKPAIAPLPEDFVYFVVNPRSKNQAEALALIRSYDATRYPWESMILYGDNLVPVENSAFEETLSDMQQYISEIEAALADASPNEKADWEARLEEAREMAAMYEAESRWDISPGALTLFEGLRDYMYINPFSAFDALCQSTPGYMEDDSFASAEALLKDLQQKIDRVLKEGGK